jgi:hypothetical protein
VFTAVTQANLVIRKNITKTVALVVVQNNRAEPRRQEKAKALGIPIITADEFLNVIRSPTAQA